METRASYIAVGSFVIALLAGIVIAFIWVAGSQFSNQTLRYETYFASVGSGLGAGSPVRVNGVQLGRVAEVALDPNDPTRVRVIMDVDPHAPIRSDSVATLEIQSLAGTTAIEISAGTKEAPAIELTDGHRYPVVWSRESNLSQIVNAVPNLLLKVTELLDRLQAVVNDQNRQSLGDTLDNLSQLTAVAAAHREDIASLFQNGAADARDLNKVIANLNDMSKKLDQIADNANTTVRSLNGLVQDNRASLKDFAQNGLQQYQQLAVDTRALVAELSRTVSSLGRDPSSVLYGDRRQGYRPQ
ncbi:MAG TPA: MlaD family protein [Stellaceae bacterium]|jgi:phospholipid/cholesterol/gamma-HCH transport system substrate-binding protein|nr:MlaD family protein [Stellaceae bacterium]